MAALFFFFFSFDAAAAAGGGGGLLIGKMKQEILNHRTTVKEINPSDWATWPVGQSNGGHGPSIEIFSNDLFFCFRCLLHNNVWE